MSEIITARLALRPVTADEVAAVLGGQRQPDWADDFPADGDRAIAGLLARTRSRPPITSAAPHPAGSGRRDP